MKEYCLLGSYIKMGPGASAFAFVKGVKLMYLLLAELLSYSNPL